MNDFFNPDNKVWSALSRICDVILISLLTSVCSLGIFTAGAACTAGCRDMMKVIKGAQSYTFKGYFIAFRENFKKSTILWLILMALAGVVIADLYFLSQVSNTAIIAVLRYIFYVLGLTLIFVCIWVFPLTATFENTVRATLKNALLMSIRHLPWTLLLLLVYAAPWSLLLFFSVQIIPIILTFMVPFGFGIQIFIASYIFNHIFKKYMPEEPDGQNEAG